MVFVTLKSNSVFALRANGGNERWRELLADRPAAAASTCASSLIVPYANGALSTLAVATGRETVSLARPGGARIQLEELDGLVADAGCGLVRLMSTTSGRYTLMAFRPSAGSPPAMD